MPHLSSLPGIRRHLVTSIAGLRVRERQKPVYEA